ncbi:MmpS family transport accessory protein [Plantibacter sp. Leaf314]|uniref:MmpS family transport accessory protein n=1 Tax=Plantibacter sp. Leaf314 TaxID=1736333 RepID=UPI00138F22C3|nr:MmpS family transport accessory protein [Plantibacter sp. Leaf314]
MSSSNQPPAQNQPYPLPVPGPAPVKTGKRGNGLGIAALIVGGFALVGAFIPILNYIAGFVGLVGLVLGSTIVSAIAIVLSIILAITYTAGFAGLVSDAVKTTKAESSAAAIKEVSVVYEVNGTATDASIVYSTYTAGTNGTEQATGQALPFIKELTVTAGSDTDFTAFSLIATNGAEDTGSVSCKITVDGDVVAEQTSTGAYASVSCSASGVDGLTENK